MKRFFLLCAVVGIGMVAIAVLLGTSDDSKTSNSNYEQQPLIVRKTIPQEETIESAITISAPWLQRNYEENEVMADQQFKGQPIEIYGKVDEIRKSMLDSAVLELSSDERFRTVSAYLAADQENHAAVLNRGDVVALLCKGAGMSMHSAMLRNCSIEEHPHIVPSQDALADFTSEQWKQLGYVPTSQDASDSTPARALDSQLEHPEPH